MALLQTVYYNHRERPVEMCATEADAGVNHQRSGTAVEAEPRRRIRHKTQAGLTLTTSSLGPAGGSRHHLRCPTPRAQGGVTLIEI